MSDDATSNMFAPSEWGEEPRAPQTEVPAIDLERLTRLVYRLMLEDLSLGQERGR